VSQRVLVFGDDTKVFLAVVRSLGRSGVEVHAAPGDFGSPALKSRYLKAIHRLPAYALDPGRWAEGLRELVERYGIGLIVPTSDASLLMLLGHAQTIGPERLALPNAEAAAIFTDKAETRRLAFAHGVPVCPGRALAGDDEPESLVRSFGLPLVLKPRRSWDEETVGGKRSARIVRTHEALQEALDGGIAGDWIVEGFFEGVGVGVSVLARDGELLAAIQHRRLQEEHETGPSTRRVTVELDPQLLSWVRDLARAARLDGVAMFEFRWQPAKDSYVLLEVNPRFWGSLPLAVAAGMDFPAMLLAAHSGHELRCRFDYEIGLAKADLLGEHCRVIDQIDQSPSLAGRLRAGAAACAHMVGLFRPGAVDSWAQDDPEPFVLERRAAFGRVREGIAKRLPQPARLRSMRLRQHLRTLLGRERGDGLRLLIVGNDNVCRSPFAEELLRARITTLSGIAVDSVGLGARDDRPPTDDAVAAAAQFGIDLRGHRARSLTPAALLSASAIIVFDYETAERLTSARPDLEATVLALPDLIDARDIADVSGSGMAGVAGEFRRISDSVSALAGELLHLLPAV
jgi:protein-tyrosine-phosphatase/predicted ATP-grasp superfamily ATP-dependent carboligase